MIVIALGANLQSIYGAPEDTLAAAVSEMQARGLRVTRVSSVWLSAPVPASDQPWYRNAVAAVETALGVPELLGLLKGIERDFGRVSAERNAARVIDLDIIAYGDTVFDADDIKVPHQRMEGRAFVVMPLQEICPDWVHPVSGVSVEALVESLPPEQEIERLDGFLIKRAA